MKTMTVATLSAALAAAACSSSPSDNTSATATSGAGGTSSGDTTMTASSSSSDSTSANASTGSSGQGDEVDALPELAAKSVCGALFRCCDDKSVTNFFAIMVADERLAGLASSLPPSATLANEAACVSVLSDVFAIAPFADWMAAVKAGSVDYLPKAVEACSAKLASAACGAPVASALYDGSCFGFSAPAGGVEQRTMFARTDSVGAACAPIRDGVGSTLYGSCDPTKAFCCYDDPAKPGVCGLPYDAEGKARKGTCKATSALGGPCEFLKNVQLCKTGETCETSTNKGKCVALNEGPLSLGAKCMDDSFNLLGVCVDSFCDLLGSKKCEALKADAAKCTGPDQCASGSCEKGTCGATTFCKG